VELRGIAKYDKEAKHYGVAAEWICARLAQVLGLPCPSPALTRDNAGRLCFVSLKFGPLVGLPAPAVPPDLVIDHPGIAAGVLAFDTWVLDVDRHAGNMAYTPRALAPAIFDHGRALGAEAERALIPALLGRAGDPVPPNHCLLPHILSAIPIGPWIDTISNLRHSTIDIITDEAAAAGALTVSEAPVIADFLKVRQRNVRTLLELSLARLPDWGLV
jgi:hypothetical protein